MSSLICLNPRAELARAAAALEVNTMAARGLQDVMKSNLGPKGTLKMLVSGAGDIKMTKDGNVLLHEMQIQHPTASMIARVSTAQNDTTGDGTTSTVLLIGELLKQAEVYISEGLHARLITEGFEIAKTLSLEVLDKMKIGTEMSREIITDVARTALRTKLNADVADHLTECVVEAVYSIKIENHPIDLHMVEIMQMEHRTAMDTNLIKGLVLDHGARHPDMKKRLPNALILVCTVSLEYEKTEVNAGMFYKSAAEREQMVDAERQYINEKVQKIIDFKRLVCDQETAKDGKTHNFVLINQKGIDPPSLEMLAKAGIYALRRAKRRNMERLSLACGGVSVNSVDDLDPSVLGRAELVYEYSLGSEKYTFIEGCEHPRSVTLLVKGPNKFTINQIKDAIYDGLRAVKNAMEDGCVVAGAGAFEVAAASYLMKMKDTVKGRARLGVQAFAEALLIIPKTLAMNSGFDRQEVIVKLQEEFIRSNQPVGIDLSSGEPILPAEHGIYDNYIVKKSLINSCCMIASNLLLVDEIIRAGMTMKG